MADKWVEEQIQAIKEVTKSASSSKEAARAFLKSAGIENLPEKKSSENSSQKERKS